MIPLRLSLEGLYSYQQKQEIDFTRLTDAALFGIFGATGSGKSSILEAITFALYGQSDRLNLRDDRGYNMMNLRSDRMHIDFAFEAGGKEYRFMAEGRRNSKNYQDVKTIKRKAFRQDGETLVPLEDLDAEKIIGLSYDNFRRTIIIPQGKFQEFLQLGETERTRMLKEIFHLQRFELDRQVKSLQSANKLAQERKIALLGELTGVTEAGLTELNETIAEREKVLQTMLIRLKGQEKSFQRLEGLRQLFEKIDQQTALLQQLREREGEMDQQALRLQHYEHVLVELKPVLDRQREQQESLEQTTQELKSQRKALVETEEDLASSEQVFASIEKEFQQRDQLLQKSEELNTIISLKQLAEVVANKESRIQNGQGKVAELKAEMQETREKIQAERKQIQKIKTNMPDIADVMAVQSWFSEKKQIQDQLQHATQQLQQNQTEKARLDAQKRELLRKTDLDARQYELEIPGLVDLLEGERAQLTGQQQAAETDITRLTVEMQFKELSEQLQEGEPCPVCGSVHHPDKPDFDNVAHRQQKFRQQIQQWQQTGQLLQSIVVNLQAVAQQVEVLGQRMEQQEALRLDWERKRTLHDAAFVWPQFNREDDASLQLHLDQFRQNQQEIDRRDQGLRSLEGSQEELEKKVLNYQKVLESLQKERETASVNFQSRKGSLRLLQYETYQQQEDVALRSESDKWRERYRSLEDGYQIQKVRLQRFRENSAKLKGQIKELDKQETKLSARLGQLNQQFAEKLTASPFADRATVLDILRSNLNVEAVREEIRRFRQQLHATQEKLGDLKAEAAGKSFDVGAFSQLKEAIETEKKAIADEQIQLGSLRNDQQKLQKDLARKQQLTQEKAALDLRGEDLKTLANLFRGSGFVNYISTIYLQNLCQAANDRFVRLTRGAMRLDKALHNNSFEVIDQLNGGRRRSVKTLSGGQTFQASLCLALALADQVGQQAREKQNFFFLDEGFGSQDKDSLRVILETLKSLRREKRIVGVISHVEELQQEIGAYLHIHNDLEKGSQVVNSWE